MGAIGELFRAIFHNAVLKNPEIKKIADEYKDKPVWTADDDARVESTYQACKAEGQRQSDAGREVRWHKLRADLGLPDCPYIPDSCDGKPFIGVPTTPQATKDSVVAGLVNMGFKVTYAKNVMKEVLTGNEGNWNEALLLKRCLQVAQARKKSK